MLAVTPGLFENAGIQLSSLVLPGFLAALIGFGLSGMLVSFREHELPEAGGAAGPGLLHETAAKKSMEGRNLDGTCFCWEDFQRARLSRASLRGTTWLDVDLRGAKLDHVDLEGATLSMWLGGDKFAEADLAGADLRGANLRGAHVRDEQLRRAACLMGATMPDGSRYDGRFHLRGDRSLRRPGIWI